MGWGQLLGAAAGYFLGGESAAGTALGAALGGGLDEATGGGATGAAREAAQTANAYGDRVLAEQRRVRDEDIARLQPQFEAGTNALRQIQGGAFAQPAAFRFGKGDLVLDPSYDYELGESIKALQRTAASRGGLLSGATLKAVSEDARQRANRGYNDAYNRALTGYNADVARSNTGYNRLAAMAGLGQTAGTQIGTAGQNYATNAGNLMINQGYNAANAGLAGRQAAQSAYGNIGTAFGSGGFNNMLSPYGRSQGPVSMPGYGGMYDPAYMGR